MDIHHTPTHSPLTLRVSGVTENSAFPTRLRLTLTLSHASATHSPTSLPQPTAHRRCATNLTALPLTPSHRHPSPRRIGDALFFRNPIRTERNGGRMGLLSPHTLSALRRCATTPEAKPDRASGHIFSYPPRQRRGHPHRCRCAADASPLALSGSPSLRRWRRNYRKNTL